MSALLTISGVGDKGVTVGLPSPYCPADGYLRGLTPTDELNGIDALLYFPDGVGFLETIKHTDSGFKVQIAPS